MPRTGERAKLLPTLLGAGTVAAAAPCLLGPRFRGDGASASAGRVPIASLGAALAKGGARAARAKPSPTPKPTPTPTPRRARMAAPGGERTGILVAEATGILV